MNKTLLIAAAALAAGVISSQAQVYSQNVVGYVNQPIVAGGYQIVGNQLVNGSDANATNGDINTCLGAGLVSSPVPVTPGNPGQVPSLSTNTVIYVWNGSGYVNYYYFTAADATTWEGATSPAGWYDNSGAYATGVLLKGGSSAFLQNVWSQPITVTTVGTVLQGTNVAAINPGYNLISLQEPLASTNPVTDGNGNALTYGLPLNMTSSNDASNPGQVPLQTSNDSLFYWTGSGYQQFFYFNAADATTWEGFAAPAGFYDPAGNTMAADGVTIGVNAGFFLYHNGSAINWTNSFTVQ